MIHQRWLLLVLTLTLTMLWAVACQRDDEQVAEPSLAEDHEAETAPFAPPADGRLTPEQVEMYIAVREESLSTGVAAAAAEGDEPLDFARLASLAAAELEAAEGLGYDPEEYQWVKGRIAEARFPAFDGVLSQIAESLGTEPSERPAEEEAAKRTARELNGELLARYDEELNALFRESVQTARN